MNIVFFLSTLFLIFALLILILKPNLIFILFSLELILIAVNINFIFASIILDDFLGQYVSLILFSVAALDTSLGLIIILNYYNVHYVSHNNVQLQRFLIKS